MYVQTEPCSNTPTLPVNVSGSRPLSNIPVVANVLFILYSLLGVMFQFNNRNTFLIFKERQQLKCHLSTELRGHSHGWRFENFC